MGSSSKLSAEDVAAGSTPAVWLHWGSGWIASRSLEIEDWKSWIALQNQSVEGSTREPAVPLLGFPASRWRMVCRCPNPIELQQVAKRSLILSLVRLSPQNLLENLYILAIVYFYASEGSCVCFGTNSWRREVVCLEFRPCSPSPAGSDTDCTFQRFHSALQLRYHRILFLFLLFSDSDNHSNPIYTKQGSAREHADARQVRKSRRGAISEHELMSNDYAEMIR